MHCKSIFKLVSMKSYCCSMPPASQALGTQHEVYILDRFCQQHMEEAIHGFCKPPESSMTGSQPRAPNIISSIIIITWIAPDAGHSVALPELQHSKLVSHTCVPGNAVLRHSNVVWST